MLADLPSFCSRRSCQVSADVFAAPSLSTAARPPQRRSLAHASPALLTVPAHRPLCDCPLCVLPAVAAARRFRSARVRASARAKSSRCARTRTGCCSVWKHCTRSGWCTATSRASTSCDSAARCSYTLHAQTTPLPPALNSRADPDCSLRSLARPLPLSLTLAPSPLSGSGSWSTTIRSRRRARPVRLE